jgi:hypothetical protein
MAGRIPENILRLHAGEESLRAKALALIEADARLALHLDITVHVMDLFDILRRFPTEDEDLKVIQVLGIRSFNAFASAIKLMLSGIHKSPHSSCGTYLNAPSWWISSGPKGRLSRVGVPPTSRPG